ncbi:hypothetical protein [Streptomyces sp. SID8352]|uniref:hypothetical protein n=1 Tax=Streptomyces sp. SID8352 TaxID=2690338 RepID=UPI00136989D0|nr:hypothetical protein [Streptomyces sp. SID8352]MYU25396.1 hypothetical protein [Streptomyces sp. SID8352]
MNRITYWALIALCVGVESWGQVIGVRDLTLIGFFAGLGVVAVHRLLLRADRHEAGEES